jgi:hypothetical protein
MSLEAIAPSRSIVYAEPAAVSKEA